MESETQGRAAADGTAREEAIDALASRLVESEQRLASLPALEDRLARALAENSALRAELGSTAAALHGVTASPSWRLTAPLRRLRQLLKSDGPRSR